MKKCPACKSTNVISDITGIRDYLFGVDGEWSLMKCMDCESRYINPWPNDEQILGFYKNYFTHSSPIENSPGIGKLVKSLLNRCLISISEISTTSEKLVKYFFPRFSRKYCYLIGSEKLRICDYGCGNGELIGNLSAIGHEVIGYDFDSSAIAAANSRSLCVKHVNNFAEDENLYDRILLMNVIEHLSSPVDVLNLLSSKLKIHGHLYVETPNPNSILANLFGKRWRGLETPRHLVLYSKRGIVALMSQSGFVLFQEHRVKANKFIILNSNIGKLYKYLLLPLIPLLSLIEIFHTESRDSRLYVFKRSPAASK